MPWGYSRRGLTGERAWSGAQAQNEVAVLASLDHPNVVRYLECFAERGVRLKIVMELCQARAARTLHARHACPNMGSGCHSVVKRTSVAYLCQTLLAR